MELEYKIKILGYFLPTVLAEVTEKEFKEKEWDFIYGENEITDNYKKAIKQLRRYVRYKNI
jgi:hypothetical protein|tara:strand:- start:92 stop:274 length:183 start_codon:yes stop_codon:yes gene_type:complete